MTFLAVNTDNSKAVAKVAPYIQAKGYDNLIVPLDTGAQVQQLLQVGGILPFLILFDGQGREIYRHIGYKDGDEVELEREIEQLLAHADRGTVADTGKPDWSEAVTATDRFEYSYSRETRKEIFENWLDVSYQFGSFRTGIMLNSQAPSEEGDRTNSIKHRFFEFASGQVRYPGRPLLRHLRPGPGLQRLRGPHGPRGHAARRDHDHRAQRRAVGHRLLRVPQFPPAGHSRRRCQLSCSAAT